MANGDIISTAVRVEGEVFARDEEGNLRGPLAAPAELLEGETLVTEFGASVEILLPDGRLMVIGAEREVLLTPELSRASAPATADAAIAEGDIADVLTALAEGRDLDEELDAAAAGIGGGSTEAHQFVRVIRGAEEVTGASFLFAGTARGVGEVLLGEAQEVEQAAAGAETLTEPSAGTDTGTDPEPTPIVPPQPMVVTVQIPESALPNGSNPGNDGAVEEGVLDLPPGWTVVPGSGRTDNGSWEIFEDGTYKITLDTPTTDVPGQEESESFFFEIVNESGETIQNRFDIVVEDDQPVARDDDATVTEGGETSGNLLDNDSAGADGPAVVSAVEDGQFDSALDAWVVISPRGTLTVRADGTYDFKSNPNSVSDNTPLTFSYTIKDADGDESTAALVIDVADVTGVPEDTAGTVFEAGLSAGTDANSDSEKILNGQLNLQDGWSIDEAQSGKTSWGNWSVSPEGTFSYTLTRATTDPEADSFSYTAMDANGNVVTNTVSVTIRDDEPIAIDDRDSVTEGGETTGNVLVNDKSGADVPVSVAGAVVGIVAGNVGAAAGGVGTEIVGAYGTLILQADGRYSYQSHAGAAEPGAQDTFSYTIRDADGDESTALLVIDVADVTAAPTTAAPTTAAPTTAAPTTAAPTTAAPTTAAPTTAAPTTAAPTTAAPTTAAPTTAAPTTAAPTTAAPTTAAPTTAAPNNDPELEVAAVSQVVYESGLTNGTEAGVAATAVSGTLRVADDDGLETITQITIGDQEIPITAGDLAALIGTTVETDYGSLTITSYTSPELSGVTSGEFGFVYTLGLTVDNDSQDGATDGGYVESIGFAVSDGESSASASIDITIVDDAPTVSVSTSPAEAVVGEDSIGQGQGGDLLNIDALVNIGADQETSNIEFSIALAVEGVDSGLRSINGEPVLLYSTGTDGVEGRTAGGQVVFAMTLNADTGGLNVVLLEALDHPTDESVLHFSAGLLLASASVTDADGDTTSSSVDLSVAVGFGDSVPVLLSVSGVSIDNEIPTSVTGQVVVDAPDEPVAFSLAASLDLAPDHLTYTLDADGLLIATDGCGETVFTLSVNANGEYTFTLLKTAPESEALSPVLNGDNVLAAGSPQISQAVPLFDAAGLEVTSVVFSANGALQPSNDGLGVDSNLITGAKGQSDADVLSMTFADMVNDATLQIGNLKATDELTWRVFLGNDLVDAGSIQENFMDGGMLVEISNDEAAEYVIDLSQNGLDPNLMFDRLELSAGDGDSYKFIGFTVEKPTTVEDSDLQFAVTAVDADGDESEPALINVRVDGSGETMELVTDGQPITLLVDTVDDMAGDTVLSGGTGVDVFAWHLSEPGARDSVIDFDTAGLLEGGDALDLSELLTDADKTDLTSYLSFEDGGDGSTLVKVSVAGEFTGDAEADASVPQQTIELQGVSINDLGDSSGQAALINDLIQSGKLIIE